LLQSTESVVLPYPYDDLIPIALLNLRVKFEELVQDCRVRCSVQRQGHRAKCAAANNGQLPATLGEINEFPVLV
jgi:hypothetical protein